MPLPQDPYVTAEKLDIERSLLKGTGAALGTLKSENGSIIFVDTINARIGIYLRGAGSPLLLGNVDEISTFPIDCQSNDIFQSSRRTKFTAVYFSRINRSDRSWEI